MISKKKTAWFHGLATILDALVANNSYRTQGQIYQSPGRFSEQIYLVESLLSLPNN